MGPTHFARRAEKSARELQADRVFCVLHVGRQTVQDHLIGFAGLAVPVKDASFFDPQFVEFEEREFV